ncbi:hypothetical protein RFI_10390 [Reticulomyxa filosa]|uniref:Uncharacterized protein n=1 Tax=Reticulomyxa filosa TaxID=46433 RepID=X6NLY2_RETFI|nr:hypothetical protein RFI_10390 [Reticulomyxa filosa]|eukprot:ETO26744.1 hypothetical protein RFI_10390 [Reticulomyxa filosa]
MRNKMEEQKSAIDQLQSSITKQSEQFAKQQMEWEEKLSTQEKIIANFPTSNLRAVDLLSNEVMLDQINKVENDLIRLIGTVGEGSQLHLRLGQIHENIARHKRAVNSIERRLRENLKAQDHNNSTRNTTDLADRIQTENNGDEKEKGKERDESKNKNKNKNKNKEISTNDERETRDNPTEISNGFQQHKTEAPKKPHKIHNTPVSNERTEVKKVEQSNTHTNNNNNNNENNKRDRHSNAVAGNVDETAPRTSRSLDPNALRISLRIGLEADQKNRLGNQS